MPTAAVKPYVSDGRARTRFHVNAWVPIIVLALIVVAVLAPRLQPGPFVGQVTVVNHSSYAFDVDVAGANGDGWMPLGTVSDHETTSVAAVFDQGPTWTLRFAVQGRVLGEVVESRADLAAGGWQVVVPDRFAALLKSAGVAPTA